MKIILESTQRLIRVNGTSARIWEGNTDSGIPVYAAIATIAVHDAQDQTLFEAELTEHKMASEPAIVAYPLRMFLD